MGCVETSLSFAEILSLATGVNIVSATVTTYTMPDPDYEEDLFGGIDETGSWVFIYDLEKATLRIHDIIYGGIE